MHKGYDINTVYSSQYRCVFLLLYRTGMFCFFTTYRSYDFNAGKENTFFKTVTKKVHQAAMPKKPSAMRKKRRSGEVKRPGNLTQ